ncbi:MAG: IgGFc-binding protein, partial [Ignavibacteria bacterium]
MKSKSYIFRAIIIIMMFAFINTNSSKAALDSKGTDFWLMFNGNILAPTITLFITSNVNTSGNVDIPGLAFSAPFVVVANTVTSVVIPSSVATHTSDVIDNKGIHVTSLDEVTVYGLNYAQYTTDAYLGLPTDILGMDYTVLTYKNSSGNGVQFGIVGTVNSTTVTITPSVTTGPRIVGVPYNITLNQGETYELRNTVGTNDLTGTTITSDQPIGVMGSNLCANIPTGYGYCDHICEMLPPNSTFGQNFVTVPLASRTNGDTWRILASQNSTTVSINGVAQPLINAGQFIETLLTGQSTINSDKPVLVAQYSNGSNFSGNPGDPFMMIIPSYEQYLANYTLTTVTGYATHYINVVAPNAIVGSLTLDGAPVPVVDFTPIGVTGFSGAQLAV